MHSTFPTNYLSAGDIACMAETCWSYMKNWKKKVRFDSGSPSAPYDCLGEIFRRQWLELAPTGSWGPSSGIASTLAPTVGAGLPAIPRHNEKAPEMFDHFRGFVLFNNGGEIGIRTLGTVASTTDFESVPFGHSGISPTARIITAVFDSGKVLFQKKSRAISCLRAFTV